MKSSSRIIVFLTVWLSAASASMAAPVMTDVEIKGYAACQAWATSVYKSPDSFPQEWVAWTFALQSTGIASPMNDEWSPFRSNPLFREALRTTREALAKEPASSESPSYKQAHDTCMAHAESLKPPKSQ